jgi:hypothetical protein
MDEPGNEGPVYVQRCFFSAMLIIAAASRDFWIGRLERLHALPSGGTQNGSATTRQAGLQRTEVSCFDQTVRRLCC